MFEVVLGGAANLDDGQFGHGGGSMARPRGGPRTVCAWPDHGYGTIVLTPWWISDGLRWLLILAVAAVLAYLPWLLRHFRAASANVRGRIAPLPPPLVAEPTIPPCGRSGQGFEEVVIIEDEPSPPPAAPTNTGLDGEGPNLRHP